LRVKDFSKRDMMVIHTLLQPDEIRDPDRYHYDYQEQLHELVQAKFEGGEPFTTEEQPQELDETEDLSDLLAKLEARVKARRSGRDDTDGETPAKKTAAKR
jgi:DNA end-binding protein Ku